MKISDEITIIFLGDIVGRPGRLAVRDYIENLLDKPDFIIANVENASHGFGLTKKNYEELIGYGINCFTSGNHIWDKREIFEYISEADRLIRPINYPKGTHGVGYRVINIHNAKIGVINVLGRTFMGTVDSYFDLIDEALDDIKEETNIIIMDIHAEATAEKLSLGRYYAQKGVTAIMGTHTHIQTADNQLLEGKCAYITDAGFCGDADSVIGMDYDISIRRLQSEIPERLEVADSGTRQVNGVKVVLDKYSGVAKCIERINEIITGKETTDKERMIQ